MPAGWELAQVNIGRLRAPVDAPEIAGFVEMLDPINAIADAFTFRHPLPPPGSDDIVETDERWNCRA